MALGPYGGYQPGRPVSDEEAARYLLSETTGLDVTSEHGRETPRRFVAMLRELTTQVPFEFTTFSNREGLDEMVVVKDIPFVSLCNHHIIPYMGVAHIGYIPCNKIVGLSKLARVVQFRAHSLSVQESLTYDIATFLQEQLEALGVIVVMEAEHLCMTIRGVQTPGTKTVTSSVRGVFAEHNRTAKAEFFEHLRRK
jgi:GTP cyclohydrolase I